MTTTPITSNDRQWDAFVLAHGGNFLQSWSWAQFQESLGRRTFRFRLDSAPAMVADGDAVPPAHTAAQFVMVDLPLRFGQRYLYVPRGPIADGADTGSAIEALRERMHQEGATFARVEFPLPVGAPNAVTPEMAAGWGFVPAGHMQPQHTVINDLTRDEPAQLAAMHQKTRYNIRVAEKHGVTVRESALQIVNERAKDVELFWQMLNTTAERDGFHTHERAYYAKMVDALAHKHEGGLRVRLFFAEFEGRAVAGALMAEFGDTITYLHGASLDADRRVMAPHALHWRMLQVAKAEGFAKYDFWGVAPEEDDKHSWAGITRFKTGFGGTRFSYLGAWELPGNRFWYRVYRIAKRLRR